jgi:hypothetical protein
MRRIKNDILTHFADTSDPKRVKNAVAYLYQKHVQNDNVSLGMYRAQAAWVWSAWVELR